MHDVYLLFFILVVTLALLVWGGYRYDTVALMSLLALVLTGLVPPSQAFLGFGNSAVISVAAIMVISSVIIQAGLVEHILVYIKPMLKTPMRLVGFMCFTGAFLSAFMNNVGALSLMMPIAIQSALAANLSPSKVLMPLSFATILGGMTTKIGTPPNLILSSYKESITGAPFSMFDFTPVGSVVSVAGVLFIVLLGWRFLPDRRKAGGDSSDMYPIQDYISEVLVPESSPMVGLTRIELEHVIEGDFSLLGLIRGRTKKLAIAKDEKLKAGDVLIIEASHDDLNALITAGQLELYHGEIISPDSFRGNEFSTIEAVVTPGSRLQGASWQRLRVRSKFGLNLLAVARAGKAFKNRLNHVNFNPGDILLIQGETNDLRETIINLGLVPLAERTINVGFKRPLVLPILLFILAIVLTSFQILPIAIAFTLVVVLLVVFKVIPMRQIYRSIDWTTVVMLGALIPLGEAMKTTGAAEIIGHGLVLISGNGSLIIVLVLLLVITMSLSDVMNNSATAIVMAPIAVDLAELLHKGPDAFLIAVGIGASCSCLTPISHQNNTLIMGPGGYKFFDYLRLGVPLEFVVMVVAIPALFYFWV